MPSWELYLSRERLVAKLRVFSTVCIVIFSNEVSFFWHLMHFIHWSVNTVSCFWWNFGISNWNQKTIWRIEILYIDIFHCFTTFVYWYTLKKVSNMIQLWNKYLAQNETFIKSFDNKVVYLSYSLLASSPLSNSFLTSVPPPMNSLFKNTLGTVRAPVISPRMSWISSASSLLSNSMAVYACLSLSNTCVNTFVIRLHWYWCLHFLFTNRAVLLTSLAILQYGQVVFEKITTLSEAISWSTASRVIGIFNILVLETEPIGFSWRDCFYKYVGLRICNWNSFII